MNAPRPRFAVLALLALAAGVAAAAGDRFDPFAPGWGSPPAGRSVAPRTAYPLGETREVREAPEALGGAAVDSVFAVYEEGRLTRVLVTFTGDGPYQTLAKELERRAGAAGTPTKAPPATQALTFRGNGLWAELYLSGGKAPGALVLAQPPQPSPGGGAATRSQTADRLWLCRLLEVHGDKQLKSVEALIASLERNSGVLSPVPEDPSCFGPYRETQGEQLKNQHTQLVALRQQMQDSMVRLGRLQEELQSELGPKAP